MANVLISSSKCAVSDFLRYIGDFEKTVPEGGGIPLVSGICCSPLSADEEFAETRKRTYSPGPIMYFSLTMVFRSSELSDPVRVHEIGREFVKRLFGDRFECIVATHVKERTLHNHIMVNAVSYLDYVTPSRYLRHHMIEAALGDICSEHGIEINCFEPNDSWISQYWAEAEGYPTLQGLLRDAADLAVSVSRSPEQFFDIMNEFGYSECRAGDELYYYRASERRTLRASKLGSRYTEEGIRERILSGQEYSPFGIPVQEKASGIAGSFAKSGNGIADALRTVCAAVSRCDEEPGRNASVIFNLGIMRSRKKALRRALKLIAERKLDSAEKIGLEADRLKELKMKARHPSEWRRAGKENEPHDDRRELRYDVEALEYVLTHLKEIERFAEDMEKGKFDRLEEKLREYGIGERVHGGHGDPSRE